MQEGLRGRLGAGVPRHRPAGADACAGDSEGHVLLVRRFQPPGRAKRRSPGSSAPWGRSPATWGWRRRATGCWPTWVPTAGRKCRISTCICSQEGRWGICWCARRPRSRRDRAAAKRARQAANKAFGRVPTALRGEGTSAARRWRVTLNVGKGWDPAVPVRAVALPQVRMVCRPSVARQQRNRSFPEASIEAQQHALCLR